LNTGGVREPLMFRKHSLTTRSSLTTRTNNPIFQKRLYINLWNTEKRECQCGSAPNLRISCFPQAFIKILESCLFSSFFFHHQTCRKMK
jgi:hypothetical protein